MTKVSLNVRMRGLPPRHFGGLVKIAIVRITEPPHFLAPSTFPKEWEILKSGILNLHYARQIRHGSAFNMILVDYRCLMPIMPVIPCEIHCFSALIDADSQSPNIKLDIPCTPSN
jgi:hypothetical protein